MTNDSHVLLQTTLRFFAFKAQLLSMSNESMSLSIQTLTYDKHLVSNEVGRHFTYARLSYQHENTHRFQH